MRPDHYANFDPCIATLGWLAGNAIEGVNGEIHVLLRVPVVLPGGGFDLNHACLLTWFPAMEDPIEPSAAFNSFIPHASAHELLPLVAKVLAVKLSRWRALAASKHITKPNSVELNSPTRSLQLNEREPGTLQFSAIVEMPGISSLPLSMTTTHLLGG